MSTRKWIIQAVTAIVAMAAGSGAQATLYEVNRSFGQASLMGTLDIPLGSYTIQNASQSPFTSVNLILTVNGTQFLLTHCLTDDVRGTGEFFINATSTSLTFSTANANGLNPADLDFSDTTVLHANDFYSIGYDTIPGYEAAYTDAGSFLTGLTLPTVFAIVHEPSVVALLALGGAGLLYRRRELLSTGSRAH